MKRRSQRSAGFTLVELMIALTISGIVIGTMYSVGSASSRHFQVQHQGANMQSSLRFAMIQVKRDLMRAGYLSTPLASVNDCGDTAFSNSIQFGGGGWIAGVSSFRNDAAPNLVDPTGNNAANGFVNDEITLVGNYATSNEYPGINLVRPGNDRLTININPASTWHSIQQDFGWAANGVATPVINQQLVQQAFPLGGLIRIQTKSLRRHFATINQVSQVAGNVIQLGFDPPLRDEECLDDVDGGWVAPLQVIRYGAGTSPANTIQSDRATGVIAQLVRTHRDPRAMDTLMPGGITRVVLDYLAAFDLSFTMTPQNGNANDFADNYVIGSFSPNNTNNQVTVNQQPQLIRAITVTLAVRAASTDPGMRFYNCQNLRCFQLTNVAGGGGQAARVRVLRSEVYLPNIANESYQQ
jgi:prepilin-type N-terminal cleavage/methylation domain-containing protein